MVTVDDEIARLHTRWGAATTIVAAQFDLDERARLVQDAALLRHVGRSIDRSGEHQFVMNRNRLSLERHYIEARWIVDQTEAALRGDQLDNVCDVVCRVSGREHEGGLADAERFDLRGKSLRVIEDVMRA